MRKKTIEIKNIDDLINHFHNIISNLEKIYKILENNTPKDKNSQDARLIAIDKLIRSNQFLLFYFKMFKERKFSNDEILSLFQFKIDCNLEAIDYITNNFLKTAYIDNHYFIFDNLFYSLSSKHSRKILDNLKDIKPTNNKNLIKVFTCFNNLRNSFHNNGVHRNADFSYRIGNCYFKFQKGKLHYNGSWDYILTIINKTYIHLEKIFMQSNISQTNYYKDDYAEQIKSVYDIKETYISNYLSKEN